MMFWKRFMLVTLVWASGAFAATAQSLTEPPDGSRFIRLCDSPSPDGREICAGVVVSIMNALIRMGREDPDNRFICPPRALSAEDARRVFLFWTEENKQATSMPFPEVIVAALAERYPCTDVRQPRG